jgi:hypothetical protein
MVRPLISGMVVCALLGAGACAPERAAAPAPASVPQRVVVTAPAGSQSSPLNEGAIAACRAEAERATVFQNRGELMRLDEFENRGFDSAGQNQQERGLLVVTRDRLFRQCLARSGAANPAQVTVPR